MLPPNGPELSCGDVQRRRGSQSARGMSSPIEAVCFARARSSTAGSVSLSDWLGRALEFMTMFGSSDILDIPDSDYNVGNQVSS